MSDDIVRMTLNCAIEALAAEGSVQNRLSDANRYIIRLEQYRSKLPDGCFEALWGIVDKLGCSKRTEMDDDCEEDYLSPEQELALAEELLSLYMIAGDGVLAI